MATHHGFIREFPFIRIDAFDGDPSTVNPYTGKAPLFYLLTHAHTDHIVGLDSASFSGQIYCTPLTKQLLLETMTAADRVRHEELGQRTRKKRKFDNLRRPRNAKGAGGKATGMDRIREIHYNTPTVVSGPGGISVTITALDANHCPGSCMWLIEGPSTSSIASFFPVSSFSSSSSRPSPSRNAAILHTGDLRVESWWLAALAKNPLVQPFLAPPPPPSAMGSGNGKGKGRASDQESRAIEAERSGWRVGKTLDCIYLDTSQVLLGEELVEKVSVVSPGLRTDEAVAALVDLIAQYPQDTRFFLNTWTWGYEEILKGVHRAFGEEIHLDRYKHNIYNSPPFRQLDPLLSTLGTTSAYPSFPPSPSPSLHARASAPSLPSSSKAGGGELTTPPLRFHACERRWRCDDVWAGGVGCYQWEAEHLPLLEGPKKKKVACRERGDGDPLVVFVNPSEMPRWIWEAYREDVGRRLGRWWEAQEEEVRTVESEGSGGSGGGKKKVRESCEEEEPKLPKSLIIPLSRHSSRPELQRLVALFQPRTVFPLTLIPPSDQHAGYDYRQLPSIFGDRLAPGGALNLERQVREYRDSLQRGAKRRRSAIIPASSADADEEEELKEPAWVKEMSNKGMNVEGGPEAFRELVAWEKKLKKGEKTPSPSQKGKKRTREEEPEVLVVDTEDEDADEDSFPYLRPPTPTTRTFDDSRREAELARLPSPFLAAPTLLPPAPIESPPTTAAAPAASAAVPETQQPLKSALSSSRRDRDRTPEPTIIPPTATATASTGRALRKSVTFAASPSPRFSGGSVGRAKPCAVSSPELSAPPPLPSLLQPVPSTSFNPFSGSSIPMLPSPPLQPFSAELSASTSSSSGTLPVLAHTSASASSAPSPAKRARLSPSPKRTPTREPSSPATRARRLAIVASLFRSMGGKIAPEGGRIEPFEEGDVRLQGRKALRIKPRGEKGKRREETPVRAALKETQELAHAGLAPSPSSFRTVEASTSP
ncbi:hypothetical protein JCM6882_002603 [Rhodosporidiobolus microsporus]